MSQTLIKASTNSL